MTKGALSPISRKPIRRAAAHAARPLFWLVLVAVLSGLVAGSWMRTMEVLVDFGREVYLPWRVTMGEHLGRDLVHPYGPLSVYLDAAWFRLFGVSVRALALADVLVLIGVIIALFVALRRGFGFLPAAVATLFTVVVFGFGHYEYTANYTFILPYSHEATHGMLLLLLLLHVVSRRGGRSLGQGAMAGLIFGLLCLTKTEYIFAATVVLIFAVSSSRRLRPACSAGGWLGAVGATAAGVLGATWNAFALTTDVSSATRATLSAIAAPILYHSYTESAHILRFLGVDHPGANLLLILLWGGLAVALFGLLTLAARSSARWFPLPLKVIALLAGLIAVVVAASRVPVTRVGSAFPLLLGTGAFLLSQSWRQHPAVSVRRKAQALLLIAAIAMMARMALAPKINHYGFFQAMLAGAWLVAFLIAEWPMRAVSALPERAGLRLIGIAFAFTLALSLQRIAATHYRMKSTPIGLGGDRVFGYEQSAYPRHRLWEQVREILAAKSHQDDTLLVLPEGLSLNYFTRLKHPLRIADALPATLPLNGRDVLQTIIESPPDWIVFLKRDDTQELGFDEYGASAETGKPIVAWILQNYEIAVRAGDYPFAASSHGLWVLQPKPGVRPPRASPSRH